MRKRMVKVSVAKYGAWLFATTLFLSSCGWLRPATDPKEEKVYKDEDIGDIQGGKVYDPETGKWRTVNEVNEKVDTVKWTDLPESKYPPIKTDSPINSGGNSGKNNENPDNKKPNNDTGGNTAGTSGNGKGDIAILLPFMAKSSTTGVPENSLWAVNFYAGARLAYDDLEEDGAKFNVSIIDSEASTATVANQLKSGDLPAADMIIGPYKRDNVELVERHAKQNKVPLIVPFTAQTGMTEENPYYIQVNPSLKTHCESMTRHIRKHHQPENVVLVALDKQEEKARFKFFQDANAVIEKGKTNKRFKELLVPEGASNFHTINVDQYLTTAATTVFVVPSWSNETFIYSLLRQLVAKQAEGEDIVVYGMSMWLGYEQIGFDYYEKLKLHVSNASYIDPNDQRVKQFKDKFFKSYGTVPTEEAYLGYDIMLYFGKQLAVNGRDFTKKLDTRPSDVLHGRFEFSRVVNDPSKHKEDLDYYDQMENKFVHILKFQDFMLQPAD